MAGKKVNTKILQNILAFLILGTAIKIWMDMLYASSNTKMCEQCFYGVKLNKSEKKSSFGPICPLRSLKEGIPWSR
jgi:hypothetical protein